jgi:predicted outer membrane repeat protein
VGWSAEITERAIFVVGTLNLSGSTVSGNEACHGGGIAGGDATLNIVKSRISGNRGDCEGGGVYVENSQLTVTNSSLSGNLTYGNGGGLATYYAATTLTASSVVGNHAWYGGGIYNEGTSAILTLRTGSSVTYNLA